MKLTTRQIVYLALALIGLVSTWYFNLQFVREAGGAFSALDFLRAGYANAGSSSLTNDLLVALAAFLVWSFAEARRLQMRRWWVYPALAFGVAFAFAFPVFLFVRERRLQALG
jgi:hypothetical protein